MQTFSLLFFHFLRLSMLSPYYIVSRSPPSLSSSFLFSHCRWCVLYLAINNTVIVIVIVIAGWRYPYHIATIHPLG